MRITAVLFIVLVLALVVFAGCSGANSGSTQNNSSNVKNQNNTQVDLTQNYLNNDVVQDNDSVQIGQMI